MSYLLLRAAAFLALNTFSTTIVEEKAMYNRYRKAAPKQALEMEKGGRLSNTNVCSVHVINRNFRPDKISPFFYKP